MKCFIIAAISDLEIEVKSLERDIKLLQSKDFDPEWIEYKKVLKNVKNKNVRDLRRKLKNL